MVVSRGGIVAAESPLAAQAGAMTLAEGGNAEVMGGGQAVMRDSRTGVNYGASDPRKDGEAIPQPGGLTN